MIGISLVFTVNYARTQRLFPILLLALTLALSNSIKAQEKASDQFMEAVAARFYSWDLDHNQTISVQELDIAIKDHANKGRSAAALAALKRASLATNFALPALTFNNIRWLVNKPSSNGLPFLVRLYDDSLRRINSLTNDQLFASALPRLETIRQGHIGDCFCLAPIGAMVNRDPREVASMFSSAGGFHCVVRIGGEAIMVPLPTDAERGMGRMAGNSHDGLWVDIYEEAMGQLQNSRKTLDQDTDPIESIANGGGAGKIISDLTGHSVSGFSLEFGKNPGSLPQALDLKMTALRWKLSRSHGQKAANHLLHAETDNSRFKPSPRLRRPIL